MTLCRMLGIMLALLCHQFAALGAGPSVLSLADWTTKRIAVHTNELTAQIPRRGR